MCDIDSLINVSDSDTIHWKQKLLLSFLRVKIVITISNNLNKLAGKLYEVTQHDSCHSERAQRRDDLAQEDGEPKR